MTFTTCKATERPRYQPYVIQSKLLCKFFTFKSETTAHETKFLVQIQRDKGAQWNYMVINQKALKIYASL